MTDKIPFDENYEESTWEKIVSFLQYGFHTTPFWFLYRNRREPIYAWQRVFRGWDDVERNNINHLFIKNAVPMLEDRIENMRYVPYSLEEEEWKKILIEIKDGFKIMLDMLDENVIFECDYEKMSDNIKKVVTKHGAKVVPKDKFDRAIELWLTHFYHI